MLRIPLSQATIVLAPTQLAQPRHCRKLGEQFSYQSQTPTTSSPCLQFHHSAQPSLAIAAQLEFGGHFHLGFHTWSAWAKELYQTKQQTYSRLFPEASGELPLRILLERVSPRISCVGSLASTLGTSSAVTTTCWGGLKGMNLNRALYSQAIFLFKQPSHCSVFVFEHWAKHYQHWLTSNI